MICPVRITRFDAGGNVVSVSTKTPDKTGGLTPEQWQESEAGKAAYQKTALKVDAEMQILWDDSDIVWTVRVGKYGYYWAYKIL